ncbi:MAG: hypothetical protein Q7S75_01790 [bacterium]|nr:hypothetical protein [bacterium]
MIYRDFSSGGGSAFGGQDEEKESRFLDGALGESLGEGVEDEDEDGVASGIGEEEEEEKEWE